MISVLLLGAFCCLAQLSPTEARGLWQAWFSHQSRNVLAAEAGVAAAAAGQQQDPASNSTAALCAKWGLQPAAAGTKQPRVFDFFIASHEYDMIEVRLHETYRDLDHIFILESRQTFRAKPKPLAYPHVLPRLPGDIIRKVHYTVLDTLEGNDTWGREGYQRDQMVEASLASSGIKPDPNDVFIMSDTDEIPKPEFIRAMKLCAGIQYPISLESQNHYYSFNYADGEGWNLGPTAMQAWQNANLTAQKLRSGNQWGHVKVTQFKNAAWHCSYCFSHASAFQIKLSSFAHSEWDLPEYHDLKRIVTSLREGWHLLTGAIGQSGAKPQYTRLPPDQVDAPQYIRKHAKRLGYLLDRQGEVGGLVDVEVRNGTLHQMHHRPQHHRSPTDRRRRAGS